ncbi:MAG: MerR family transcriptional regulator [Verrucomicrobiales bacterium]|nr:MerR family transcriptional regulator [Verrucomicrobiales bacterium]
MATDEFFEISAVARLTGISQHVLRVWEKRYDVVTPTRTESGRRRYSREDLRRLTLLKTLTDNDFSIGSIAGLSTDQLETRLAEISPSAESERSKVCRIALVGSLSCDVVRSVVQAENGLSVVAEFTSLEDASNSLQRGAADIIVVEKPTVFPEAIAEVQAAVAKLGARRALLVYNFAFRESVKLHDIKNVTALRAPVDESEFRLAFLAEAGAAAISSIKKGSETKRPAKKDSDSAEDAVEEPLYSNAQLAAIARHSSVVQCECPQHLASLLSSLGAFEDYSAECESRNEEDAALHARLYRTTAKCRAEMEEALSEVLDHEGITVEPS